MAAGGWRGEHEADGKDEIEQAQERGLSCQWVLVAGIKLLAKDFPVEDFDQAVGLLDVSLRSAQCFNVWRCYIKRYVALQGGLWAVRDKG